MILIRKNLKNEIFKKVINWEIQILFQVIIKLEHLIMRENRNMKDFDLLLYLRVILIRKRNINIIVQGNL